MTDFEAQAQLEERQQIEEQTMLDDDSGYQLWLDQLDMLAEIESERRFVATAWD